MSQPSKMFIAKETLHKSWQYQISRRQIFQYSNILKSDTPFHFTYISAPEYLTEKFLYSRQSYGSHLSEKLCSSLLACLQPEKLSKNCGTFLLGFFWATLQLLLRLPTLLTIHITTSRREILLARVVLFCISLPRNSSPQNAARE